ncbi:hypothetical protein [Streptomyces sp. NPDC018584]|uniref:hypothetical protein n=2 Tax=unclassified Streptomyces TaxID=2593676 RepID=UPI0037A7651A
MTLSEGVAPAYPDPHNRQARERIATNASPYGAARTFDPKAEMIKKVITCAAIVAAAMAVGTSSAAAHDRDGDDRKHRFSAEWGGGNFDVLKSSSGTGIFSGSGHHGEVHGHR